jgi:hypothetical protein
MSTVRRRYSTPVVHTRINAVARTKAWSEQKFLCTSLGNARDQHTAVRSTNHTIHDNRSQPHAPIGCGWRKMAQRRYRLTEDFTCLLPVDPLRRAVQRRYAQAKTHHNTVLVPIRNRIQALTSLATSAPLLPTPFNTTLLVAPNSKMLNQPSLTSFAKISRQSVISDVPIGIAMLALTSATI